MHAKRDHVPEKSNIGGLNIPVNGTLNGSLNGTLNGTLNSKQKDVLAFSKRKKFDILGKKVAEIGGI
jgi:hypothetical protein